MSSWKDTLPLLTLHWHTRENPGGHTPRRVLRWAEELGENPDAPTAVRALAGNLAEDVYTALGWDLPKSVELNTCRNAARSARHSCSLLLEDLRNALGPTDEPMVLMGELGIAW